MFFCRQRLFISLVGNRSPAVSISLAPIRYRSVFGKYGGPIERLEVFPQLSSDGRERHSANAFLHASLRPNWVEEKSLYSNSDGSGTHLVRNIACYIAISEALERWAFYSECEGVRRTEFGFDADPSTTGMASFPGLTTRAVRSRAAIEAAERWTIVEWWLGRLPSRLSGRNGDTEGTLEITSPFSECAVAIVWRVCSFGGLAYGFAGGATLSEAIQHALVEQDRNIVVLEKVVREKGFRPGSSSTDSLASGLERRLAFFASAPGEALFRARVDQSRKAQSVPPTPRTLVDCEIQGPWNRYTTVWRVLYEQSSDVYLDESRNDFFLF